MNGANPSGPKPYKRRTIIVKKSLQYRYMALICLSVLAGFALMGLELAWDFHRIMGQHPACVQPVLDDIIAAMPLLALKLAIYMGIVVIVSSIISHKMAGPIFKFEKAFRIIGRGELSHRVFLRKGDMLLDVQNEINAMAQSLHDKVKAGRDCAAAAAARLESVVPLVSDENARAEILSAAAQVKNIDSEFKL